MYIIHIEKNIKRTINERKIINRGGWTAWSSKNKSELQEFDSGLKVELKL